MANKTNLKKVRAGSIAGYNLRLSLQAKEEIHVFEEKPRICDGADTSHRRDAHELFSLFTADIIKEKAVFTR
jgi:hypothetical protein